MSKPKSKTKIAVEDIKKLRALTDVSIAECHKAMEEARGDFDGAIKILKERGTVLAEKKVSRTTKAGFVGSYVHTTGRVGALVELRCETDFVARNDMFRELAHDLAIQVTGYSPYWVHPDRVPEPQIAKMREEYTDELTPELKKKPAKVIESILQGKLNKFLFAHSLLTQPFFRDENITVEEHVKQVVAKLGENIVIERFYRMEL